MTTKCNASVWPHRHTNELTGPLDLTISYKNQYQVVRDWSKKDVQVHIEQPDDRTNLTIIDLAFGLERDSRGGDWHRVRAYRRGRDQGIKVYIRGRFTNQMEHPIPRGTWQGTYRGNERSCLYTFQAMTMKIQPTESRIVLPTEFSPGENRVVLP